MTDCRIVAALQGAVAGALSLLSLLAAVLGEFIVRRLEIAEMSVSGMVAVTLILYDIFKAVNKGLSARGIPQPCGTHVALSDRIIGAWTSSLY